ncbi:MAG: hypothetical protein JOZ74_14670 [Bradyrhizobium sp.]|nr:hypothetical protein [Bradyrhizobium sp.]
MKQILAAIAGVVALTGVACAGQAPVALVEDVQGKVTGAEFMDYVVPGQVIKLGAGGSITLGYMKSCWRETISGIGTVIVGTEQSSVHLAEFKAGKVPCDSGLSEHIGQEVGESAATVVRSLRDEPGRGASLVLHGVSPVVAVSERGKLVVDRLDAKGEHYELDLAGAPFVHGKFYDFAKANIALKPGGTYSMKLNAKSVAFVVDADAAAGPGPVISRLVSLR